MKIKNAKHWAPVGLDPWLKSLAIFLFVFGLRLALHPLLGARYPLTGFVMATLYIQYRFGLAKSICAALLGFTIGEYAFVQPFGMFDGFEWKDLATAIQFFALTVTCMVIIQRLRASQYQSKLLAEVADSRYIMLLQSESDREAAERSFSAARLSLD